MTNIYKIPTNKALIDSLSVKIDLRKIKVLDERLTSMTCIYFASLDAVDELLLPPKPVIIEYDGITVRLSIEHLPLWNEDEQKKISTPHISLTVSAKLLKEFYFQGINKNNLKDLYNEFMSFKVFYCSYHDFKTALASDVDVMVNQRVSTPKIFQSLCRILYNQCGTRKFLVQLFTKDDNSGISFNKRRTASPSLPFIKFYHKKLELLSKSKNFYNRFLTPFAEQIEDMFRVEATIKNYDHKRRLKKYDVLPMFKTVEELLEIPQAKLYDFVCFSLGAYIEKQTRLKSENMTPTDHLIFQLIQNSVFEGHDLNTLLPIADAYTCENEQTQSVARTRLRNKIKSLYQLMEKESETMAKISAENTEVMEILKHFKLPAFEHLKNTPNAD